MLVELDECGPLLSDSSVNFGVSGTVFNRSSGTGTLPPQYQYGPVFATHTTDQLPLWRTFRTKSAPRLFNRTAECRARRDASTGDSGALAAEVAVGVTLAVLVLGAGLVITLRRRAANRALTVMQDTSVDAHIAAGSHGEVSGSLNAAGGGALSAGLLGASHRPIGQQDSI